MLEGKLPGPRLQLRDPIRQLRRRIEPRCLGDPFQMQHRPEIVAPKRDQFETARGNRLGVRDDVAATFGDILGLKIGADQDRRIVMHGSHHVRFEIRFRPGPRREAEMTPRDLMRYRERRACPSRPPVE